MIRVCHMTSVHAWNDVRIFHKECRSLAAAGFDVHLVACAPESSSIEGVTIHSVQRAKGGRIGRMLGTASRVYRVAKAVRADIYHLHDPELIPYGILLEWQRKKVIYDVHEDVPRDIVSKSWIAPWLRNCTAHGFEQFENWAARRFSAIAAATPHIARRFSGMNARSIAINNYPMQSELVDGVKAAVAGRTICYVGGVSRIRGAVEMIAALEHVDAQLILAGNFESPSLEAQLRGMAGWGKVSYRGMVSRADVRKIFAESRIGLVLFHPEPNHIDAQPNKLFEYMSAGLPIIASDFPLWRELLDNVGAGVCANPLNPRDIAARIAVLLDDAETSVQMGAAGRKAVLNIYRWEHEAAKLTALYGELAGQ